MLFLLSVVLWLMFGTYRRQLDTILDTVKAVGNGDIKRGCRQRCAKPT
ncbi:hypothetical protein [Lacticaseibacillus nasuensis]|nr:hypothetical protein [Lacticaseibacillus nasuensis]